MLVLLLPPMLMIGVGIFIVCVAVCCFFFYLLDVVLTVASSSKAQLLQEAPCRIPEIPLSSFLVTVGALMAEVPKGGLSGDGFLSLFGSSPS